ncbi:MAG TPA: histidine kinase dimerization/phospho-acceptor domain-containing protein [Cellvibrionaceae bacterium]
MKVKTLALSFGIGIWMLAWWAMLRLEAHWDFTNLAMILMLASTLAAVLLPPRLAALALVVSVLVFDWRFIEPKGSLVPHLQQHLWFWISLTAVNIVVLALMAYLRIQLVRSQQLTAHLGQLNQWHQILLENQNTTMLAEHLLTQLTSTNEGKQLAPLQVALKHISPQASSVYCLWGAWQLEQLAGVDAAEAERRALGPGTGCYERWQDVVLPILGRKYAYGALVSPCVLPDVTRRYWQLMCDQLGAFCDRKRARQNESQAIAQLEQERTSKAIIAAVSHDFRTPLATIIGASSALLAQENQLSHAEQQAQLQRIYQQAQHLSRVSQNLLQLARLGSDAAVHCSWEDVGEMVGSLLSQLVFKSQVHIHLPERAQLIWCNSVLINQALFNLLENAHRYGPANTAIHLSAHFTDQCWLWRVQDAGLSLTTEQARARQKAFLQGEEAAHPSGVGLGLALCEAIAKAHKGALTFSSEPSSTWQLALPQPPLPKAD